MVWGCPRCNVSEQMFQAFVTGTDFWGGVNEAESSSASSGLGRWLVRSGDARCFSLAHQGWCSRIRHATWEHTVASRIAVSTAGLRAACESRGLLPCEVWDLIFRFIGVSMAARARACVDAISMSLEQRVSRSEPRIIVDWIR